MGRKKRRHNQAVARGTPMAARAVPIADWLPPESGPCRYYSQLVFTDVQGSGPLCIVGRELQLVWYDSEKHRDREKNGKLVAVLEFQDCWSCLEPGHERYFFTALLMEEVSGEYRRWLGNQQHQGRSFADDTDVLETQVRFSVVGREAMVGSSAAFEPASQPFFLEQPSVESLSSPQLDMLFDVMSFLYQGIPAMKLMQDLLTQEDAPLAQ